MHPIQDMVCEAGYRVEKSVSRFVCIHAFEISDTVRTRSVYSSAAASCKGFDGSQN